MDLICCICISALRISGQQRRDCREQGCLVGSVVFGLNPKLETLSWWYSKNSFFVPVYRTAYSSQTVRPNAAPDHLAFHRVLEYCQWSDAAPAASSPSPFEFWWFCQIWLGLGTRRALQLAEATQQKHHLALRTPSHAAVGQSQIGLVIQQFWRRLLGLGILCPPLKCQPARQTSLPHIHEPKGRNQTLKRSQGHTYWARYRRKCWWQAYGPYVWTWYSSNPSTSTVILCPAAIRFTTILEKAFNNCWPGK